MQQCIRARYVEDARGRAVRRLPHAYDGNGMDTGGWLLDGESMMLHKQLLYGRLQICCMLKACRNIVRALGEVRYVRPLSTQWPLDLGCGPRRNAS